MPRIFSADDLLKSTVDANIPVFLDTTSWKEFDVWAKKNLKRLQSRLAEGLIFWVFVDELSHTEPELYRLYLRDQELDKDDTEENVIETLDEDDDDVEPIISFKDQLASSLGVKFRQEKLPEFKQRHLEHDEIDPKILLKRFLHELQDAYFYDINDWEACDRYAEFVFLSRQATQKNRLRVLSAQPAFQRLANAEVFYLGSPDLLNNKEASLSIFGEPSLKAVYQCDVFMVMPFAPKFTAVYQQLVRPTVEELGLTIKRGDDPMTDENIMHEVWSMINACKVVIADCTDLNANVFYEIGMAHSIGKQVIPLIQDASQLPFDIRHRRAIVYNTSFDQVDTFKRRLKETLRTILNLS